MVEIQTRSQLCVLICSRDAARGHGSSFSVPSGYPSLNGVHNIYKEGLCYIESGFYFVVGG